MKKNHFISLGLAVSVAVLLSGCGGSDSDPVYKLTKQFGTQSKLFYGEVNPQGLGSLTNASLINPDDPGTVVKQVADTTGVSYPVLSTRMQTYVASSQSYTNLYVDKLHYVSGGKAYTISLKKGDTSDPVQNSSIANLTKPNYTKIDYIGSRIFLTAKNGGDSVLITGNMGADDAPIQLENRKLLSVTYPGYGEDIDGYLLYNNDTKKVEKCSTDMADCTELFDAGSRDFKGDIKGTVYAVFVSDGKVYKVDKSNGTKTEISLDGHTIASGHGTTSLHGNGFYFIGEDHKLYVVDLKNDKLTTITSKGDDRLERVRGFTDDYVIYGSDNILLASKKNGSTATPILMKAATSNSGYKYVNGYGIKGDYLYVTYDVDPDTAKTTYEACMLDKDGNITCKKDSFWAAVTIKKDGKRDFEASFTYTPYAYIRVDDTDSFGGGTLKAIDPAHPFDDGISMGKIEKYNFQTFLSGYRYTTEMIDSEGGIVLYAKNDTNFHVDAFYMNLLKAGSFKQLTNTNPKPAISQGRDHCHGRHCAICHNFAGGKIYQDKKGEKSAYGYQVRLDFEDGGNFLAEISKGKGENFSIPLEKIKGKKFKANILDKNGKVVNHSAGFYHDGIKAMDCNYCHGRSKLLNDAPSVITIEQ